MSLKKFLSKKSEQFSRFKEQKHKNRQLKEKLEFESLKEDARRDMMKQKYRKKSGIGMVLDKMTKFDNFGGSSNFDFGMGGTDMFADPFSTKIKRRKK